jgi:hypothetical protein
MSRNHEKLLIATLAGIIIAGAAAFAIQPALASTADPKRTSQLSAPMSDLLLLQLPHRG